MCLVVCFMLLLVVCCHLANKEIYIYPYSRPARRYVLRFLRNRDEHACSISDLGASNFSTLISFSLKTESTNSYFSAYPFSYF